jgi:hypothetical protein
MYDIDHCLKFTGAFANALILLTKKAEPINNVLRFFVV